MRNNIIDNRKGLIGILGLVIGMLGVVIGILGVVAIITFGNRPAGNFEIPAVPDGNSDGNRPAKAQIILNGDFEIPTVPNGNSDGWLTFFAGETIADTWTVNAGSVDIHRREYSTPWTTLSGLQALDLSGNSSGSIYQDVPTTPGMDYRLQFYMSANLAGAPPRVKIEVLADGTSLGLPTFDTRGRTFDDMGWEFHEYLVHAVDSSTRIEFRSLTSRECGPAIDGVRMNKL